MGPLRPNNNSSLSLQVSLCDIPFSPFSLLCATFLSLPSVLSVRHSVLSVWHDYGCWRPKTRRSERLPHWPSREWMDHWRQWAREREESDKQRLRTRSGLGGAHGNWAEQESSRAERPDCGVQRRGYRLLQIADDGSKVIHYMFGIGGEEEARSSGPTTNCPEFSWNNGEKQNPNSFPFLLSSPFYLPSIAPWSSCLPCSALRIVVVAHFHNIIIAIPLL